MQNQLHLKPQEQKNDLEGGWLLSPPVQHVDAVSEINSMTLAVCTKVVELSEPVDPRAILIELLQWQAGGLDRSAPWDNVRSTSLCQRFRWIYADGYIGDRLCIRFWEGRCWYRLAKSLPTPSLTWQTRAGSFNSLSKSLSCCSVLSWRLRQQNFLCTTLSRH